MHQVSRVHYLNSINRKVTEQTSLGVYNAYTNITLFSPSFNLSFLSSVQHMHWMLWSHPKLNKTQPNHLPQLSNQSQQDP